MPAIPGIKTNTRRPTTGKPIPTTVLQFAPFLNPAKVKEQP